MGLKPAYRIKANEQDITDKLQSRLVSLRLTDESGLESDTLEIILADHDPEDTIRLPPTGAVLEVAIGYDDNVRTMGLYIVDELELSGPPRQMRIAAHASPQDNTPSGLQALQTQRSRSWPVDTTIGTVITQCASDSGLTPAVAASLAGIKLPHIDQTNESNINLLTRIAKDHDAIAKPGGGKLVMVKRGQSQTASGQALDTINIHPADVTTWSVLDTRRNPAGTVIATYRDTAKAEDVEVVVGEGDPIRRLPHTYSRKDSARRAAQAELNQSDRAGRSLRLTLPGNPELMAETTLAANNFRDGVDGNWLITRVEHWVSPRSGYVCRIEGEQKEADEAS